ncbi:hypothetical protein GH714_043184 [Hevea brasiliensis]|uniref:UspA domain-containing protein n=1 Tax=Hevea brasiliensis TaxID=3981 RepID=A0A6A6K4C7_HEVBR|nr:hypothetical protein GH714_043184 [Hevea brasiliensis]
MTSPSPKKESPAAEAVVVQPSSPRFPVSTRTSGAQRRIGIAVDLSDESAYAVKWAVQNYLRQGDAVILVHVRSTSVLYGADWGAIDLSVTDRDFENQKEQSQKKLEEDFDLFTSTKANDLAQPLVEAQIPFKIHIVKDHDMKERLCLEVERLGLCAVIMGSRGFGASRKNTKGRLGSVSDYCVHHCVCPVIVVRFPDEKDGAAEGPGGCVKKEENVGKVLPPVVDEAEQEYHDASDKQAEMEKKDIEVAFNIPLNAQPNIRSQLNRTFWTPSWYDSVNFRQKRADTSWSNTPKAITKSEVKTTLLRDKKQLLYAGWPENDAYAS